jgi:hypothetical protein
MRRLMGFLSAVLLAFVWVHSLSSTAVQGAEKLHCKAGRGSWDDAELRCHGEGNCFTVS